MIHRRPAALAALVLGAILVLPSAGLAHPEATSEEPECHTNETGGRHCHFRVDPEWKNLKGAGVEEMRACLMELQSQCARADGGAFCSQSAGRLCRSLGRGMGGR